MSSPEALAVARITALRGPTPGLAARALLNVLVGSPTAKALHARHGAANALVALLPSPSSTSAPAAAALGSLATRCESGALSVADAGAAAPLVEALFGDWDIVPDAARAVRALLASRGGCAAVGNAFRARAGAARRVVEIMGAVQLRETAAGIVGGLVRVGVEGLEDAGVVAALVNVLKEAAGHAPSAEAALAALAELVHYDARVGRQLVEEYGIVAAVLPALRARGEGLRMRAARLLTSVHCAARGAINAHAREHAEESVFCGPAIVTSGGGMDEMIMTGVEPAEMEMPGWRFGALPRRALCSLVIELIQLMDSKAALAVRVEAPRVLAKLVQGSPRLQEVACEAGVVHHLKSYLDLNTPGKLEMLVARPLSSTARYGHESLLRDVPGSRGGRGRGGESYSFVGSRGAEGGKLRRNSRELAELTPICPSSGPECDLVVSALECLAAVCALHEKGREACIVAHVIPPIVLGLQHGNIHVVLASVKCVRSLSRSVKVVRRELVYVNIAVPLLRLLKLNSLEVKREASACICNVAVEFSPLQETVLRDGGVPVLVDLVYSNDTLLRLNSLWALQNMMYRAKPETRRALMENLGYHELVVLCRDLDTGIRTRAVMLLRNLVCAVVHDPGNDGVSDLGALLGRLGEDNLFDALADALAPSSPISVVFHAIYVILNIASGPEWCKVRVLNSRLAGLLLRWTEHDNEQLRVAVLYCVINLAWHQSLDSGKSSERAGRELSSDIVKRRPRVRRRGWLAAIPPVDADVELDEEEAAPSFEENADLTIGEQLAMQDSGDIMEDDDSVGAENAVESGLADMEVTRFGGGTDEAGLSPSVTGKYIGLDSSPPFENSVGVPEICSAGSKRSSCHTWRIQRLCELGFEKRCLEIIESRGANHVDVVGRALNCLTIMRCSSGQSRARLAVC